MIRILCSVEAIAFLISLVPVIVATVYLWWNLPENEEEEL
jgi:hypothetical protein